MENIISLQKLLCFLIILAGGREFVSAQSETISTKDSLSYLYLIEDSTAVYLNEYEITAAKKNKDLISSSPIRILSEQDILTTGITDISDALRRLPGVNIRDYGGAGGLKTVSVRGLGAQHTGVIYDGVPLSDVQSGQVDLSRYSINDVAAISLDISDNDDIALPARASAYASNIGISSSGYNLSLKKGYNLEANLATGSFEMINPSLKMGYNSGNGVKIAFNGDFIHAKNNYPYKIESGETIIKERRKNSDINSGHIDILTVIKLRATDELKIKAYFFDSYRHLPGPAILYSNTNKETLKELNTFGQINYISKLSDKFSLLTFFKFNYSGTDYTDENEIYSTGIIENSYKQNEAYLSASLCYRPIYGLGLSYSFDYVYNNLHSNQKINNNPSRNSILQCLSAKYNIWRLSVTTKALFSFYQDRTGEEFSKDSFKISPSIGISIRVLDRQQWYLRLSYKNIFRMPSFNELYFQHYGTINLNPEDTHQFNIGTTYSIKTIPWLRELSLTIDGYFNTVRNKILAVPYNMFIWTMSNMGKVDGKGIELSLYSDFPLTHSQSILLTGAYTYNKVISKTSPDYLDWNKQLPYTPEHSGSISINWENPWVSVGCHGIGCSSRYATANNNPESKLKGYTEVGFTAYHVFHFSNHSLEIRADMINAFNQQYEIVTRYPMPGRNYKINIKFIL